MTHQPPSARTSRLAERDPRHHSRGTVLIRVQGRTLQSARTSDATSGQGHVDAQAGVLKPLRLVQLKRGFLLLCRLRQWTSVAPCSGRVVCRVIAPGVGTEPMAVFAGQRAVEVDARRVVSLAVSHDLIGMKCPSGRRRRDRGFLRLPGEMSVLRGRVAIHSSTSDWRHPTARLQSPPRRIGAGKEPSLTRRCSEDRPRPVVSSTSAILKIRSPTSLSLPCRQRALGCEEAGERSRLSGPRAQVELTR